MRAASATLALLLGCWAAWLAAGWLLEALGLDAYGLLGRAAAILLLLSLAEAALHRWS